MKIALTASLGAAALTTLLCSAPAHAEGDPATGATDPAAGLPSGATPSVNENIVINMPPDTPATADAQEEESYEMVLFWW